MAGQRRLPQARDRALGAELKVIRLNQTTLSVQEAARLMDWSPPTMSRTENGKRHVSAEDVSALLALYGVSSEQRDALVARAKSIDEPGWWSRPLPGVPDLVSALASYEAEAHTITDWSPNLIPGMLQTYEYSMALMLTVGIAREVAEIRWMARLRRQQRLPEIDYTAYIGEAAVRTPFGDGAFIGQLRHLLDAGQRGIGVRILPQHIPSAALIQSWMLLEFPDSPPIVHSELLRSAVFLHNTETEPYLEQVNLLRAVALAPAESRNMLKMIIEQREQKL